MVPSISRIAAMITSAVTKAKPEGWIITVAITHIIPVIVGILVIVISSIGSIIITRIGIIRRTRDHQKEQQYK
jgi:hypothetical protein